MKDRLLEHWDINYLVSFLYIFLAESDFVINKEEAIAKKDRLIKRRSSR